MWKSIVKYTIGKESNASDSLITTNQATGTGTLKETIHQYLDTFDDTNVGRDEAKIEERQQGYQTLVKSYYNLVTDFYEYGWGASFHFSPKYVAESFREGTARHEYYLASRLGLTKGKKVLDCGCGIGGPMRQIAKFSGCNVTGITINEYQVQRSNQLIAKMGLQDQCRTLQGDFMQLDASLHGEKFDCAYGIEATCHAPNKQQCFEEIYHALKPGGLVAVYEWAMTPLYDQDNAYHNKVKHEIEKGDGLPNLPRQESIVQDFERAGFTVLDAYDLAAEYETKVDAIPWYATLQGGWNPDQFKHSKLGRFVTHVLVTVLEFLRIAPKGTATTHLMLCDAAEHLAIGGEMKIFTPMFFVLAQKPL
ncbi:hypothetical protein BASA81_003958 [Batrachochytrium salamandrivorans]|nr:hypothetical protein BASA81_003958 [Batrachochytrium salamandrivorans]